MSTNYKCAILNSKLLNYQRVDIHNSYTIYNIYTRYP